MRIVHLLRWFAGRPIALAAVALLCLTLIPAATSARAQGQGPTRGQVCFEADFESTNALSGWSGTARLEPGFSGGKSAACLVQGAAPGAVISRMLPLEKLRGCTVRCTAMVRAEEVGPKPNAWNGIKFMLVIESPSGPVYPQAPLETGNFDWHRAAFTAQIPADVTKISLVLGLEQVRGKAWFDDLKIVVTKAPQVARPAPVPGSMFQNHPLVERLRGAMISPGIDADSLAVLGRDWKANLIRWQLIRFGRPNQPGALDDYDAWLDGECKKLEAALPLCEKYGLFIAVDLHSPPGGRATVSGYAGSDDRLFTDRRCQDKFVEVWRRLATRLKGARPIWGFDLANEPVEDDVGEGCDDWQGLAERAARAIREIDPQRTIIVEPTRWGDPSGLNDFQPLPLSNVVYSVHMYLPHAFTHQGVHEQGKSFVYPGEINGKLWNRAELERALQPAIDFQQRYHVPIYIGEFSAIRWAPDHSAGRYLSDVISIFEAHGWDWSYHAFREWQGWSVEHGSDKSDSNPSTTPSDRQKLLRDWFARNQKPNW